MLLQVCNLILDMKNSCRPPPNITNTCPQFLFYCKLLFFRKMFRLIGISRTEKKKRKTKKGTWNVLIGETILYSQWIAPSPTIVLLEESVCVCLSFHGITPTAMYFSTSFTSASNPSGLQPESPAENVEFTYLQYLLLKYPVCKDVFPFVCCRG